MIAHRLSTVKGANKIFAFKEGKVCEEGTHDELMSDEGLYYSLVRQQLQRQEKEEQELVCHCTNYSILFYILTKNVMSCIIPAFNSLLLMMPLRCHTC